MRYEIFKSEALAATAPARADPAPSMDGVIVPPESVATVYRLLAGMEVPSVYLLLFWMLPGYQFSGR